MPIIDLHTFTEETITKLEVFEKYLAAWLPVFIHHPRFSNVTICDFFAGEGEDKHGMPGSPLRILKILKEFQHSIVRQNLKVSVILNEYKKRKFNQLCNIIKQANNDLPVLKEHLSIEFFNLDFKQLFNQKKREFRDSANLMFLDQNGIKQVNEEVFLELETFSTTDFMFFISSSYFKRFGRDFKKLFPNLDFKKIKNSNYSEIHRVILDEYKKMLPDNSKTKLYPFSIKKGANIYGLIFGAKHPLAADKFLHIVWDKNQINGEANFDLDDEWKKQQTDLFEGKRLTKIEEFQSKVEQLILSSNKITNKDIYDFTIENGHIPKHSIEVVKRLKKEKFILYSGHPRINYNSCYKNKSIRTIEVLKK